MGVYLPNVDMPKDDKVVTIRICPNGSIWQQYRGTVPNAKAVPVPPHGRLIDKDALIQRIEEEADKFVAMNEYDSGLRMGYRAAKKAANLAPTIIPAEEGE